MGETKDYSQGKAEFREPFRLITVSKDGKPHLSPGQNTGDPWDDDMRRRVAEFFRILDQWDRALAAPSKGRIAA